MVGTCRICSIGDSGKSISKIILIWALISHQKGCSFGHFHQIWRKVPRCPHSRQQASEEAGKIFLSLNGTLYKRVLKLFYCIFVSHGTEIGKVVQLIKLWLRKCMLQVSLTLPHICLTYAGFPSGSNVCNSPYRTEIE